MYADKNIYFWTNIGLFFTVYYLDLAAATCYMLYAMLSEKNSSKFSFWFNTKDDTFCSLLTLITFGLILCYPFYVFYLLLFYNEYFAPTHFITDPSMLKFCKLKNALI